MKGGREQKYVVKEDVLISITKNGTVFNIKEYKRNWYI